MIDIVLATYNGERFLQQQIESIQQNRCYQKLVNRFIIVDDGSSDRTREIVEQLAEQDSSIEWHRNTSGQSGVISNFSFGISQTSSDYIMLSDQDDVWLPNKIANSLAHLQKIEQESIELKDKENSCDIKEKPILVFTDKQIVDQDLEIICDSYFELKSVSKSWHKRFEQLAQQNVASGCTMLFNRALLDIALPIPKNAYMHDWWLALVACRCGSLEFLDNPLIQYRQHSANTIGAKQRKLLTLFTQFSKNLTEFQYSFNAIIQQAQAFQQFEIKHQLAANPMIATLSNIKDMSRTQRIKAYREGVIDRSNYAGKVALLITLLFY